MQEPRLCIKPVYKFERAFICDEKNPEFCLIYSEADDPEEIFVSVNANNLNKFDEILSEYKIYKLIYHGENGKGELCESFYYDGKEIENIKYLNFKLLTLEDKNLAESKSKDDYLNVIFEDFIENKLWHDCGIIGVFDENNNFAGYLAYYEIAKNIRDVSYIYVKSQYRGLGYAKKLLKYFKNKNRAENKISYYSYADGEISAKLIKSCGFLPCAKRMEAEIKK